MTWHSRMTARCSSARLSLFRVCVRSITAAPIKLFARPLFAPRPHRRLAATAMAAPAAPAAPAQFSAALTSIDLEKYEVQLEEKAQRIRSKFAEFSPPELQVFRSQPQHYRMRSEFRVWHDKSDKDGIYYIMFEKDAAGEARQVRVDQFPVASQLVNQLMAAVMEEARQCSVLRTKLYQVNFHTTLSGESMVTLIYHRKLDKKWEEAAGKLREVLAKVPGAMAMPSVIGRSRGQKVVLGSDEVQECLEVDGQQLKYIQVEASFSQPNAGVCCSMLSWARSATAPLGQAQPGGEAPAPAPTRDLLELYCGNGNFTAAVAHNFRQVVATEVSKSGVAAAKRNFELNAVSNVFVARMSSEEFTEAWKGGRAMNRLQGLDLGSCDFQTLLVDPPRAGLDEQTVQLLRDFRNVVYISCNPDTLHRDLQAVKGEFEVKRFAMFDQFPYTHHVECGVYLERRQGAGPAPAPAGAAAAAAAAAEGAGGAEADEAAATAAAGEAAADGGEGDGGGARGVKRKLEEDGE